MKTHRIETLTTLALGEGRGSRSTVTSTRSTSSSSASGSTSVTTRSTEAGAHTRVVRNGVVYEIFTTGATSTAAVNDQVIVQAGEHVLEIQQGQLTVDGMPVGQVTSGDRIRLAEDGTVTVNGEQRT